MLTNVERLTRIKGKEFVEVFEFILLAHVKLGIFGGSVDAEMPYSHSTVEL